MDNVNYRYDKDPSLLSKITQFGFDMFGAKDTLVKQMEKGHGQVEPAEIPHSLKAKNEVEEEIVGMSKVWTITPKTDPKPLVIFYLHGGAYISSISKPHWKMLEEMAAKTGSVIVVPDYPLAPKHTYLEAYDLVEKVYEQLVAKYNTSRIIIMGDSAGGGLSLGFVEKRRNENKTLPEQIILLSPWLDVTMTNPEIKEVDKKDEMLNIEGLILCGKAYAGDTDTTNYMISPIYGDLDKLPKVSLFTGTNDVLNPDARKFRDLMRSRSQDINYFEYKEMFHVWVAATFLKESQLAIDQIVELLSVSELNSNHLVNI